MNKGEYQNQIQINQQFEDKRIKQESNTEKNDIDLNQFKDNQNAVSSQQKHHQDQYKNQNYSQNLKKQIQTENNINLDQLNSPKTNQNPNQTEKNQTPNHFFQINQNLQQNQLKPHNIQNFNNNNEKQLNQQNQQQQQQQEQQNNQLDSQNLQKQEQKQQMKQQQQQYEQFQQQILQENQIQKQQKQQQQQNQNKNKKNQPSQNQCQQQLQTDFQDPGDTSTEEIGRSQNELKEESLEIDKVYLQQLVLNQEQFFQKIIEINDEATKKLQKGEQQYALDLLLKAEKFLEFAASCGQPIDRNLIVVVLYNRACAYQSLWVLDRCSKYVDGVIYNLEISIEEEEKKFQEEQKMQLEKNNQIDIEAEKYYVSHRAKKQTFLAKSYLQYCAILSQLGIEPSYNQAQIKEFNQQSGGSLLNSLGKEQIQFQSQVINYAQSILKDLIEIPDLEEGNASKEVHNHFLQAKQSLYFWKNNPENNERHIRQELNVPLKESPKDQRSLLGVANGTDWIEVFNIGTIMHMNPVLYKDFTYFGDILYEISKRNILEKVIYLSICYFTIATEIRFLEIDKIQGPTQLQQQEGFKRSEIYHLKSIEIVCKYIVSKSPYINHLITSYHKHYNQSLETIQEEASFYSNIEQTQYQTSNNQLASMISENQKQNQDDTKNNQQNNFNQILNSISEEQIKELNHDLNQVQNQNFDQSQKPKSQIQMMEEKLQQEQLNEQIQQEQLSQQFFQQVKTEKNQKTKQNKENHKSSNSKQNVKNTNEAQNSQNNQLLQNVNKQQIIQPIKNFNEFKKNYKKLLQEQQSQQAQQKKEEKKNSLKNAQTKQTQNSQFSLRKNSDNILQRSYNPDKNCQNQNQNKKPLTHRETNHFSKNLLQEAKNAQKKDLFNKQILKTQKQQIKQNKQQQQQQYQTQQSQHSLQTTQNGSQSEREHYKNDQKQTRQNTQTFQQKTLQNQNFMTTNKLFSNNSEILSKNSTKNQNKKQNKTKQGKSSLFQQKKTYKSPSSKKIESATSPHNPFKTTTQNNINITINSNNFNHNKAHPQNQKSQLSNYNNQNKNNGSPLQSQNSAQFLIKQNFINTPKASKDINIRKDSIKNILQIQRQIIPSLNLTTLSQKHRNQNQIQLNIKNHSHKQYQNSNLNATDQNNQTKKSLQSQIQLKKQNFIFQDDDDDDDEEQEQQQELQENKTKKQMYPEMFINPQNFKKQKQNKNPIPNPQNQTFENHTNNLQTTYKLFSELDLDSLSKAHLKTEEINENQSPTELEKQQNKSQNLNLKHQNQKQKNYNFKTEASDHQKHDHPNNFEKFFNLQNEKFNYNFFSHYLSNPNPYPNPNPNPNPNLQTEEYDLQSENQQQDNYLSRNPLPQPKTQIKSSKKLVKPKIKTQSQIQSKSQNSFQQKKNIQQKQ
ncbi:hypothetical protein PPERSA_10592 [Pseudocohnilembus persalinus]|uniref:Uncharacterized protein n=1 Tax=Pseudocohnilembus persalinus TaxID=266149 RepID=A0A0V0Q9H0_PSEPJ|nr:hypothetical protein PPERSA_10592 [Pseudocohnilembus persalinus]|eukprot:KRW98821.1 hypothetical protein PPERSA_10592 [Pseudocohnilembus persalinus]